MTPQWSQQGRLDALCAPHFQVVVEGTEKEHEGKHGKE
jgi:hypothetical protein